MVPRRNRSYIGLSRINLIGRPFHNHVPSLLSKSCYDSYCLFTTTSTVDAHKTEKKSTLQKNNHQMTRNLAATIVGVVVGGIVASLLMVLLVVVACVAKKKYRRKKYDRTILQAEEHFNAGSANQIELDKQESMKNGKVWCMVVVSPTVVFFTPILGIVVLYKN